MYKHYASMDVGRDAQHGKEKTTGMWLFSFTLLFSIFFTGVMKAQSTANYLPTPTTVTTGVNASLALDMNGNAVDLTTGSTSVVAASSDDTQSSLANIGFDFYLMGTRYTQFSGSDNGIIGLGAQPGTGVYTLPNSVTATVATIAPFGNDMRVGTNGIVRSKVVGTAPNRCLVVEWSNNMIRYISTAAAGTGTFQLRLYESTGVIEFVYGGMTTNAAAPTVYYVGFSTNSTANNIVTINTTGNAASTSATPTSNTYTASSTITQLNSASNGNRRYYRFIPPTTSSPTGLNFTSVAQTTYTLNWTNAGSNRLGTAIYYSTDNVTYTYLTTTTAAATSQNINGMAPATTYFWKLYSLSEGYTGSTPLAGSQATTALVPLTGTKTIDNTLPTSGSNYASFTAAVNDLNTNGVGAGGVTFNVTAGQTFSETVPTITATGTLANQIIFQKNGAGANPILTSTGAASIEAAILINGGDYFTFDGINIATTGTLLEYGYYLQNSTATNGAQNNTFKNFTVTLNRSNGASLGVLQIQSSTTPATSAAGANSNNKYYNFTIKNANSGILLTGTAGFPDLNCEIGTTACATRNTIGDSATTDDILYNGAAAGNGFGIRTTNQGSVKVFNNDVTNISTNVNNSTVDGIFIDNSAATVAVGTSEVYNNKINAISNTSTGANTNSVVRGIRVNGNAFAATITRVYNNFITNLQSGNTNTTLTIRRIIGISLQPAGSGSGSGIYAEFNSVRIGAANLTVSNACLEMGTGSGPAYRVRNNILANVTAAQTGGAKHYCWVSTQTAGVGNTGSLSNYNDLYVTGTNGFVGLGNATDYATLTNWQLGVSQDGNSVSTDPTFTSATDLHASSAALNGAADPSFATNTAWASLDIDCASRPTPTDIGADEYNVNSNDAGVTAIVIPTLCAGSQTVQATIKNYGAVTLTSVKVDWTVNGNAQTQASPTVNIAPGASATVTIGTFTFVAGTTYSIVATTSLPNGSADANTANDGFTQGSIATGLSGSYTVGAGGSFTTLTAAVAAYNARAICGPVTFTLTDAAYGSETFPITINANAGANATNTLLIKPSTTASITGSNNTAIILLNGADYVTINGSTGATTNTICPASAASRDLTLTNNSANATSAVVWLQTATADGATNNNVINCNLVGSGANQTFAGIGSGSSTMSTATLGTGNNNNSFINNNISKATFGIVSIGASASNKNTGTVINQNVMTAASPNQISRGGILVGFENGVVISGNNIANLSGASSNDALAISLGISDMNTTIAGNEVTSATITKNTISAIRSASTYSTGGIVLAPTANSGTNTIANNLLNDVIGNSTFGDFSASILIGGGTAATNVYHNTINMTAALTGGSFDNFGIAIGGTNPTVNLRNNIVVNTATNGTGSSYALGLAYSTVTNLTSNYNDFYVTGTTKMVRTVTLSNTGGTDYGTLATWNTASTKDANSKNVLPAFASASDVRLNASSSNNNALNAAAVSGTGITDDIDCEARNGSTPDIGADEFTPPVVFDLSVTALTAPAVVNCYSASENVTFQITNSGNQTWDFSTLPRTISATATNGLPASFGPVALTGTLAPGATTTVTVGTFGDMRVPQTYSFTGTLNNANESGAGSGTANDSFSASRTSYNPSASLSSNSPICSGTSLTLTATNSGGYNNTPFAGNKTESPALAIPDNSTTGASSTIALSGAIGSNNAVSGSSVINVTLNIAHSFLPDLDIYLVGPGNCGTLELSTDNGASSSAATNYSGTVLTTTAGTNISTITTSPIGAGPYTVEGSLTGAPSIGSYIIPATALSGCPINGNWTLRIFDDVNADSGTLSSWSLSVAPTAAASGNYSNSFSGAGTIGSISYSGTNNTTATVSVTNPTTSTYSVSVTDASGCSSAPATTSVTVNPLPTLNVSGPINPICGATTADLTSIVTSNGTVTYFSDNTYTTSVGTPTAVTAAGTYYVRATSAAGCITDGTVTVNAFKPFPTLNVSGAIDPACGATTADLTSVVTSNGTVTYFSDNTYTTSVGTPTAVTTAGTYYVRATSAAGCTTDGTITVNAFKPFPTLNVSGTIDPICGATTADLTSVVTSNGTVTYFSDNTYTTSVGTPSAVTAAGTYYVRATSAAGCTTDGTITVNAFKPFPTLNVSGAITPACGATTADLTSVVTSNGTLTYFSDNTYTTSVGTPTAVTAAGTYYVRATSAAGCTTDGTITVNAFRANPIVTAADVSGCSGTPIPLSGSPAGGSFSVTNPYVGTSSTTYTYTYTAPNGCTVTSAPANITITPQPLWYLDADGDHYYTGSGIPSCTSPGANYTMSVLGGGDCDDASATVYPGAPEICYNNILENCSSTMSAGCAPVVVNMTPSYHNTTLTSLSQAIPAVAYTYAPYTNLKYRFSIKNVTTGVTAADIIQTSRYVTIPASIHTHGAAYDIKASAVINEEIVPFAGNTIRVNSPAVQLITLNTATCGATLASLTSTLTANQGLNATGYTFRIRLNDANPSPTYATSQSATRFVSANSFTGFPLQYGTSYKVSVQYTFTDPVSSLPVQSGYGAECTVNTPSIPLTTMASPTCGSQVATLNANISATAASYATGYQFRIRLFADNGPTPAYTYSAVSASRFSSLTAFGTLAYNTAYSISVQYSILNGATTVWSGYGPECKVTTPFFPTTSLVPSQCGLATPTSLTQQLNITPYPGFPHYKVLLEEVSGEDVVNSQEREITYSYFKLSDFSIAQPGKNYNVSVAIKLNGVFGDYSTACDLFTAPLGKTITVVPFKATAYPNPFANNFMLDVKSSSESNVNIKVYDMIGRLIEQRDIRVSDMQTTTIGNQYPSGVYNVVVSQEDSVETVRVVKR
ncbi:T9SS type A sorting domain-containing protein [Flavobacterium wongokense]|uniref:T9SS type A sorting domain-containing protein n=1 Tax=Flavobacterium wongokense TaxID=2910674 RepID=UPI001F48993A|nr:T9SS type A sorting domain-containing protein [Flavobacterium sp. WG47]MCF6133171.1 T9SS type A sorting domain-containing protein [Flavobacterium sp. WG47]